MYKNIYSSIMPPLVLRAIRRFQRKERIDVRLVDGFTSWQKARDHSDGIDNDIIFNKVCEATMKFVRGEVIYQRDSVSFDKIQYSWPLLSGILWVASKNGNELNIIDFGGSLGSTYFQNEIFLKHLKSLRWNIVEQKKYAEFGKKYIENQIIHFYYDLDQCARDNKAHAVILSSVLMYLEKPYAVLEKIIKMGFQYVLVDRTFFIAKEEDVLTVQMVPAWIVNTSYPCWILSFEKFIKQFSNHYNIIADFNSFETTNLASTVSKGYIFQRK